MDAPASGTYCTPSHQEAIGPGTRLEGPGELLDRNLTVALVAGVARPDSMRGEALRHWKRAWPGRVSRGPKQ